MTGKPKKTVTSTPNSRASRRQTKPLGRASTNQAKPTRLSVYNIVGGHFAISTVDGVAVRGCLEARLSQGENVTISFARVDVITPVFFYAAIGGLYLKFAETRIKKLLRVTGLRPDDALILKHVIEAAKGLE